jgi:hypothetical protein
LEESTHLQRKNLKDTKGVIINRREDNAMVKWKGATGQMDKQW